MAKGQPLSEPAELFEGDGTEKRTSAGIGGGGTAKLNATMATHTPNLLEARGDSQLKMTEQTRANINNSDIMGHSGIDDTV